MRVGIIAEQLRQPVPGGIGSYVESLLGALDAIEDPELEALAIASSVTGSNSPPLARHEKRIRLPHRMLMALWDRGIGLLPDDLDLLHLTSLAGPSSRRTRPTTAMVHDLGWRRHPELTTRRGAAWHEAALGRILASSTSLIVPSSPIADELVAAGAASRRISIIGHGCDHLPPPDDHSADDLLDRLHVEGPFVLTVSTVEPRKNLPRLVEAHRAANSGLPLVVVGPEGWGRALEPSPKVLLAGQASPGVLAALYGRCQLFVYVPVLEGFGLPPLEAMFHGAPVIASTATPSMQAAPGAILVNATDVPAMSTAIISMLTDDVDRSAAASTGQRYAATRRWSDSAAQHLELWRSLL